MPDLVQRDLPRSFFREGRIGRGRTERFNFQDGRWARAMGARPAFQASSVQYSKLVAQRIGASKRDLPAQDPLPPASASAPEIRQSPPSPPSTLIHLRYLLVSIGPCCNFCQLQNPNNLVLDTLAPKV